MQGGGASAGGAATAGSISSRLFCQTVVGVTSGARSVTPTALQSGWGL